MEAEAEAAEVEAGAEVDVEAEEELRSDVGRRRRMWCVPEAEQVVRLTAQAREKAAFLTVWGPWTSVSAGP